MATKPLIVVVIATTVILLSLLVLIGWFSSIPSLVQLHPSFVPMQTNTAVCFLLSGVSLISLKSEQYLYTRILSLPILLISFLTLMQYVFGIDLQIDQLLIEHNVTVNTPFPGRMSLNTTLCFISVSAALLMIGQTKFGKNSSPFVTVLAGLITSAGIFSLIGYIVGYEVVYTWSNFSQMAAHTSLSFLLIGGAILYLAKPTNRNLKSKQLWVLYSVAPFTILIVILLILLMKNAERIDHQNIVDTDTENFATQIQRDLNDLANTLGRMSNRWEIAEGTPKELWQRDAQTYLNDLTSIQALVWIDANTSIRWIEPMTGNEEAIGSRLDFEETRKTALAESKIDNKSYFSKMIQLVPEGEAIFLLHPVYVRDSFDGWLLGIISVDALRSLDDDAMVKRGYEFRLSVDGETYYSSDNYSETLNETSLNSRAIVTLTNRNWIIDTHVNGRFSNLHDSSLALIVAILMGFLLLVLTWVIKQYFRSQDLIQTQTMLRAAIQSSLTGFVVTDQSGKLQEVNQSLCDWLGYKRDEILDINIFSLVPDEQKDDMINLFKNLVDGEIATVLEKKQYLRKDGNLVWGLLSATIVKFVNRNIVSVVMNITDIQEQEELAIQLQEAQDFQNLITDNNPNFIFVKDEDFKIIFANPAFLSLYPEKQRDSVIGTTTIEDYPKDEADAFLVEDKKAFREGRSEIVETIQFPNGQNRMLSTTKIRFNNSQGENFILGVCNDVTEREELITMLEKSNKDLDQFAYVASHDLKSPLNAIQKIINWIEEDCLDLIPEKSKEHFTLLKSRAQRMSQLLVDLLQYSRIGRYEYKSEMLDLEDLSNNIFELVGLPKKFSYEVEKVKLTVPRIPFEIVLRNLISNAIKHHDKETGMVKIDCETIRQYYVLKVSDDGSGIPPSLQKRAIEMFQTLQSRDVVEGSGMGLAIVKRILEHYDGYLSIDSDGKNGTTIIVKWPTNNSYGDKTREEIDYDKKIARSNIILN